MESSIYNTVEYIDRYLLGELSAVEREAFERAMAADAELRRSVALQRQIVRAIEDKGMRKMLQGIERQHNARRRRRIGVIASAVLAVAACIVAAVMWVTNPATMTLEQQTAIYIAQAHSEMRYAYGILRGCDDMADALLKVDTLMSRGDYEQAYYYLDTSVATIDTSDLGPQKRQGLEDMMYLQALCAVQTKRYAAARQLLLSVADMDMTHKKLAEQLLTLLPDETP